MKFGVFFLVIQVCWGLRLQAKYQESTDFVFCPYVPFLPPDDTCVALAFSSQNHGATNIDPQLDPTGQKNANLCQCSGCTQGRGQWQGPKNERKGRKIDEGKRGASAVWREVILHEAWGRGICSEIVNIYDSWACAEEVESLRSQSLNFMFTKLWQQVTINNTYIGQKCSTFSDNMNEISRSF